MTATVFITGGAGFIGSRLTHALAPWSSRIIVFDNLLAQVHGPDRRRPTLPANAEFVEGDVRDAGILSDCLSRVRPQIVYHLAADTGTGQSYDQPSRYCDVNVGGTARLIEALRPLNGVVRRVVLASSRAVYGEGPYRTVDGTVIFPSARTPEALSHGRFTPVDPQGRFLQPLPATEDVPAMPASVYASTKLMQEFLLKQGLEGTSIHPVLLRLQNVYGPGQSVRNPYTGILSIFARQLLEGKRLNVFEDGGMVRDFIFIDDVVAALTKAAMSDLPFGVVINVGTGFPARVIDVARILMMVLKGCDDAYDVTGDFRPGDIRHAVADISRARQLLGWEPKVDPNEGLVRLADWARKALSAVP